MADHTKGPWRAGKTCHSVVADTPIPGTEHTGHSDVEYYGGYLICESVWKKEDWDLIIAAPDMYDVLKELVYLLGGDDPIEAGCHCIDTGTGRILVCPWCKAKQALAKAEGVTP